MFFVVWFLFVDAFWYLWSLPAERCGTLMPFSFTCFSALFVHLFSFSDDFWYLWSWPATRCGSLISFSFSLTCFSLLFVIWFLFVDDFWYLWSWPATRCGRLIPFSFSLTCFSDFWYLWSLPAERCGSVPAERCGRTLIPLPFCLEFRRFLFWSLSDKRLRASPCLILRAFNRTDLLSKCLSALRLALDINTATLTLYFNDPLTVTTRRIVTVACSFSFLFLLQMWQYWECCVNVQTTTTIKYKFNPKITTVMMTDNSWLFDSPTDTLVNKPSPSNNVRTLMLNAARSKWFR